LGGVKTKKMKTQRFVECGIEAFESPFYIGREAFKFSVFFG
jgi:hypothetical protein